MWAGKKNDNEMQWPLLTFGSKTEPAKLVFTIENEKLVSADEVRVTIGSEGNNWKRREAIRRGGMMGRGGLDVGRRRREGRRETVKKMWRGWKMR